jgi:AraC-like DNA-binding protein
VHAWRFSLAKNAQAAARRGPYAPHVNCTDTDVELRSLGPSAQYFRISEMSELFYGVKPFYESILVLEGRSECWVDGLVTEQLPDRLYFKEPGQVHRDLRRESPLSFQAVTFDGALIDDTMAALGVRPGARFASFDLGREEVRAAPLTRLHALAGAGADAFTLETAITEGAAAFVTHMGESGSSHLRPHVRRARAFLLDHLSESITLDALAEHARLDKFHLARAFTAEVGLPPYAFLLHARIARARALLRGGMRPSDVALALGFCDQSQFHRHFVRIVGATPGAYARTFTGSAASRRGSRPARARRARPLDHSRRSDSR